VIHSLVRFESGPGRPRYIAACGHASEQAGEFTKVINPSTEKVTCPECLAKLARNCNLLEAPELL
jgi:hypothetical protein